MWRKTDITGHIFVIKREIQYFGRDGSKFFLSVINNFVPLFFCFLFFLNPRVNMSITQLDLAVGYLLS